MDQVGRSFQRAASRRVPAENDLKTLNPALCRREGQEMQMNAFGVLSPAVGPDRIVDYRTALLGSDSMLAIEIPRVVNDTADVLAMIAPGTLAWAKLADAATSRIDHRASCRVRTGIPTVRNAVSIAIARSFGMKF